MTPHNALQLAAAIIARQVSDIATLADLLEIANQRRLAQALQALSRPAEVGGAPRPDAALWAAAADRAIGGER